MHARCCCDTSGMCDVPSTCLSLKPCGQQQDFLVIDEGEVVRWPIGMLSGSEELFAHKRGSRTWQGQAC